MTDPIGPPPTIDADAAWFRSQVAPVVEAAPVADTWSQIEARAMVPAAADEARPTRARWLAAAAAMLLLVGGAVVLTSTRDDGDDRDRVTTEPPAPTGWYVPVGLPPGWQVETIEAHTGGAACARRGAQWSDPSQDRSMSLQFDGCGHAPTQDDVPELEIPGAPPDQGPQWSLHEVDLGGGVTATGIRTDHGDPALVDVQSLNWNADGGAWTLQALGLGYDEQVAIVKRLAADPDRSDVGVAGLDEVDRWTAPERDGTAEVQVGMVNPDGLRVVLMLSLPGSGNRPGGSSVLVPVEVAGQPEPVLRYDTPGFWAVRYGGAWPGADWSVMRITEGPTDPAHMITDADIEQLIGSLRPATTEQWHAFVATATKGVSPSLLDAATLQDLAAADAPDPGEPGGDLVMPTTTTAPSAESGPDDGSHAPAPTTGPVTSAAGTATPLDKEQPSFTELGDLDIRLELASGTIRAGQPVAGTLVLTNRTDHEVELTECSEGFASWGLVPADRPDAELPPTFMIDCFDTSMLTIPAHQTVRYRHASSDPEHDRWPFAAQRANPKGITGPRLLGTLDGGAYLAVVQIPGRTSTVRVSVPVTVDAPDCATTDATVTAYANLTAAQAQAKAETHGDQIRIVSGPGAPEAIEQDLRCDRINLDLNADRVVINALRY